MESSWKQVFGLHIWEGKSLWLLHNQDVPKRWKDCWSSSNGNLSTNQISAGRRSTNHCDLDINILLCLPPYSRRPGDSMFDKGLHASHGEKLPNHLHVRGNYWALYQEKDGQPVIEVFWIAVKLPSQQTASEEEPKEHVIRQLCWNWRQPNLGKKKQETLWIWGKISEPILSLLTANKPKKLRISPKTESLIILD